MQLTTTELSEFLQLPKSIQDEISIWQRALEEIGPPIQRALANLAEALGVSIQTARRKYYAWLKHGWRALVNNAKVPKRDGTNLDPDFIEYWKKLCQENGRKCRPAYRRFVEQFKSRSPIPGIDPGVSRGTIPRGYSYDNLMRFAPTQFERFASRIGRSAASPFRPKVITTRAPSNGAPALPVGARYIFDDLWHDFEVVSISANSCNSCLPRNQRSRLLQLHAHDLASACQFARGLKPRLRDEESGRSVQLTQNEMLFLVAHVLAEFGYHPDGCILMVEHGTAAISETIEQILFDLTNGRITVDRSGIEGVSSFAGQYAGRSKGNFRFKASLESLGNLIHNETANLLQVPGQTGSNSRINLPEELHGRQRHADALLNAIVDLPPARAAQLRLPFLEVNQAKWLVNEIMERINRRTDHELEGWLECGHVTTDLFLPGVGLIPSSHYLSLPADRRSALDAVASPAPRKLSPLEVFDNGKAGLAQFRPEQTARLLLEVSPKEVRVGSDYLITIEDKEISPSAINYLAHHLAPGDKFQAALNPWSLDFLHLFNADGSWFGRVELWQPAAQTDPAAIAEQMGRAAKIEAELLRPVAARGLELTRKRLEDSRHNAGVLGAEQKEAEDRFDSARANLRKAAEMF